MSSCSSVTAVHNTPIDGNGPLPFQKDQSVNPSVLTVYNSDDLGTSQRSKYHKIVRRSQGFRARVSDLVFKYI